jgi:hypothetical protein
MPDLYVMPFRLLTGLVCIALVIITLPLVVYLRAHDALDEAVSEIIGI